MNKAQQPYQQLLDHLRNLSRLASIEGLIQWDEEVNLPSKSAEWRAEQNAAMAIIVHGEASKPEVGKLLEQLEKQSNHDADQQLVIREARKDYDQLTKLPTQFVADRSEAASQAYHAWNHARKNNNFAAYAPHIQKNLDFALKEADYLGKGDAPYDHHLDKYTPGMTKDSVDQLFTELRNDLVPLVKDILKNKNPTPNAIFKNFPIAQQKDFLTQVMKKLGFDFDSGRIDISLHPFCAGNIFDTRMTTRYQVDNPLDSLFSAIHETGHALYQQGVPKNFPGTALCDAEGMAVHESQSRLWENQVGRSPEFWKFWEPRFRKCFPEQLKNISSKQLFETITSVEINPIRTDSDEVTYNLHIILRFEIEKALFEGAIQAKDLPKAWNELSEELLGYHPKNDSEGVLQDIHWAHGSFGYFPSYCLGNMLAAQLWATVRQQLPELKKDIINGNYRPLLDWLRNNVHQHGKRYNVLETAKRVTQQPLQAKPLIDYLRNRYLS